MFKHHCSIYLLAAFVSFASTTMGSADNRELCAEIVQSLGFPTDDYAYERPGLFRMERHQFGTISCYLNASGEFDSLYRGEIPLAEDGFFGEQVLRERDRLISERDALVASAREARDNAIERAREDFRIYDEELEAELTERLAALRAQSDPRQGGRHVERLEELRQTDPDAYLDELALMNEQLWLQELRDLRPEEYALEMERRELEAQRDAEREAAQRREEEREEAAREAAQRREEEQRMAAEAARIAREQQEREEERRSGFHCLNSWDGSHREFRNAVRDRMRDPDSFEHVATRVTPVDGDGMHTILMEYRARNGFGGMNLGAAVGQYRNSDCSYTILSVE